MTEGLIRGRIPENAVHLCIDMQRMFAEDTPWRTPWMNRVLPVVAALCEHKPERTCFTRFIPAERPGEGRGTWRGYWERWPEMTVEQLGPEMVGLIPALAGFAPPAKVLDKR
jgi:nicotinamidase-related amidase